ncbi:MAG: transcriptional repressor LexA [Bacteroidetes bacterium]|nr:transcriptional repressor LexA [Bacteroidota bacterium]
MNKQWTDNRRKVARFLQQYIDVNGRAPSMDEIAKATGLWKRSVEIVLKGLEKIGFIEITPGISRGIRLVGGDMRRIPLVGDVKAGPPAWGQEEAVEYLRVDRNIVPFENPMALRVDGYSMRDAGMLPGDIVLVKQQQTANNGETVVAYLNGGLTVKQFEYRNRLIRLLPANPAYKPIEVTAEDEFQIVGRVMLLLRDVGDCFNFEIESADSQIPN